MKLMLSALMLVAVFAVSMVVAQEGAPATAPIVGKPVPPAAGLTPSPKVDPGQRWVFSFCNFANVKTNEEKTALVKQAKAAGYTAIKISDTKFSKLHLTDDKYKLAVQAFRKLCKDEGLKLVVSVGAFGYCETFLSHDPNLAEGQPVRKAQFVVKDGKLVPSDDTPKLVNGSFEDLKGAEPAGWDMSKANGKVFIDDQTKTDGKVCIRMQDIGSDAQGGQARVMQKVKVRPWCYYILSAKSKTEGFTGKDVRMFVTGQSGWLNYANMIPKKDDDWKTVYSAFCSQDDTEVTLSVGAWEGKAGKIWFDDVKIQPGGFVNVIRRDSLPLTVTSEDGKTTYVEGKDFSKVVDPLFMMDPNPGYFTIGHVQPAVTVPAGSALKEGQRVLASYHFAIESGKPMQMNVCMAEPGVYKYLTEEVQWMKDNVDPDMYFMGYDEMRAGGYDDSCVKSGKTPGQLLAESVARMTAIIKKIDPGKPISTWSDMFDPTHNANPNTKQFYMVKGKGPWAGAWEGLSSDILIVNWRQNKPEALKFFGERGNQQILAGYYDKDPSRIIDWLTTARDLKVPGVVGVMYTTWKNSYKDLKAYCDLANKFDAENKGK